MVRNQQSAPSRFRASAERVGNHGLRQPHPRRIPIAPRKPISRAPGNRRRVPPPTAPPRFSPHPRRHRRLHPLRAAQGPQQDRLRRRLAHRAPDVCRRRPRRRRRCAGHSVRRQGRATAQQHDRRHGPEARGSLHRQRGQVPSAGQPHAGAGRGNTCSPFLFRQIDVVRPQVLVALGATAATYLLGARQPLAGLRGRVHAFRGMQLIVTYHPAYLLRDRGRRRKPGPICRSPCGSWG
jgi:hypothetical protein